MKMRRIVFSLIAVSVLGCKAAPKPAPAPSVDLATAGSVTGVVSFTGNAPKPLPIDMSADPACAFAAANTTEQIVVADHKLANVYVYIKAGAPSSSAAAADPPVVLDQKGCRYIPHVIAVQQGGSVEFKNSDPTMHNIHTTPADGSASVDMSEMPMGAPQSHTFTTPQTMLAVRCNNHPWMQAFLNVAPNPYFAVTGADGSFTIKDLPPGTYTLAAVQEKLGEQDMQVTVAPKSTSNANITFAMK
jgi:plastocyanin